MDSSGKLVRWIDVGRPGYLGKHRDEKYAEWDFKYGKGNWRLAWMVGFGYVDFLQMCKHYEESYYKFLKGCGDTLDKLVHTASDIYDDSPTNTHSGLDYTKQETNRTHIQDIAIRNAVRRLGRVFEGKKLVQIRDREGSEILSVTLSPGTVPFYDPEMIVRPQLHGWWTKDSIESFYQSNKTLQLKYYK